MKGSTSDTHAARASARLAFRSSRCAFHSRATNRTTMKSDCDVTRESKFDIARTRRLISSAALGQHFFAPLGLGASLLLPLGALGRRQHNGFRAHTADNSRKRTSDRQCACVGKKPSVESPEQHDSWHELRFYARISVTALASIILAPSRLVGRVFSRRRFGFQVKSCRVIRCKRAAVALQTPNAPSNV